MLTKGEGNLLDADVDALVNTVNTVGVMGKGIALQFKQAYPANFRAYEAACRRGEVQLGKMFTYETGLLGNPRFVINATNTAGHPTFSEEDALANLFELNQTLASSTRDLLATVAE